MKNAIKNPLKSLCLSGYAVFEQSNGSIRQLLCIFLQTVGRSGFGDDARGASGNEDEPHADQGQHRQRIVENNDA